MNKRIFEIEWSGDTGPMWMNASNLLTTLIAYCPNITFTVEDVTNGKVQVGKFVVIK